MHLTRVEGLIHGFIQYWEVLEHSKKILEEIATLPKEIDVNPVKVRH